MNTNLLVVGDPLVDVQREAEHGLAVAQKVRFGLVIDIITSQLGLIRSLRGLKRTFGSFDDEQLDEFKFRQYLSSKPDLALAEGWYWIRKLQAHFIAGDYTAAVDASTRARRLLWTSTALFEMAECCFYDALTHAALLDSAVPSQRQQYLEALTTHHKQLEIWAEHCPDNFENRAAPVGAEIACIEHRDQDAMKLYEQAIASAHANGFVQNEAVAYEVAAGHIG